MRRIKESDTKVCRKCGAEKAIGEFSLCSEKRKDGSRAHVAQCKVCRAEENCCWRKKNSERMKKCISRWENEHRFHMALKRSRATAKRLGYEPCDATAEGIEVAFTGKCHFCGMTEEEHRGRYGKNLFLDHNHKGKDNFRGWLCHVCNARDVLATKEISNES